MLQNTTCAETIICTKCDYVIKRSYKLAQIRWPGSDIGWLGIAGHGVGVREVPDSNPGGTTQFAYPYFGEGVRVLNNKSKTQFLLPCKVNVQGGR